MNHAPQHPQIPRHVSLVDTGDRVVDSLREALIELERAGHHQRLLSALRFVLVHHEPTRAGRCRACRRVGWRGLWRRRRFPCVVWRQIRGELLGHLTISGFHRRHAEGSGRQPVPTAPLWQGSDS